MRRALGLAGTAASLDRIARARARARAHVWDLIEGTPAGFPWLVIAGKALTGWLVMDMDATLVTASSDKEGAGNWPGGLRWIARRVRPSRLHLRNLTDYEKKTAGKRFARPSALNERHSETPYMSYCRTRPYMKSRAAPAAPLAWRQRRALPWSPPGARQATTRRAR